MDTVSTLLQKAAWYSKRLGGTTLAIEYMIDVVWIFTPNHSRTGQDQFSQYP